MNSKHSAPVSPALNQDSTGQLLTLVLVLSISISGFFLSGCGSGDSTEDKAKKDSAGKKDISYEPEHLFSVVDGYAEEQYRPSRKLSSLKTFSDYLKASREALDQKAYTEAARLAEVAISLDETSGKAHYIRGKALSASASGDDAEALAEMNVAVNLGCENGDLYEYMAKIYDGRKDYPKAIKALTRAIKLAPGDRDNVRYRGALYDLLGDHKRAEADYTRNIEMSYENPNAYIDRGMLYEGNKEYEKALADYDRAVELAEKKTDAMTARARAYILLGRDEEALKDLNEIISVNPNDDDSIRTRGDIYARRKDFKAAIRDYTRVIRHSPDLARTAYESRAKVYEAIGEKEKAAADRKTASAIKARPAEKTLFKIKRP